MIFQWSFGCACGEEEDDDADECWSRSAEFAGTRIEKTPRVSFPNAVFIDERQCGDWVKPLLLMESEVKEAVAALNPLLSVMRGIGGDRRKSVTNSETTPYCIEGPKINRRPFIPH
jgi:hypothetical protein